MANDQVTPEWDEGRFREAPAAKKPAPESSERKLAEEISPSKFATEKVLDSIRRDANSVSAMGLLWSVVEQAMKAVSIDHAAIVQETLRDVASHQMHLHFSISAGAIVSASCACGQVFDVGQPQCPQWEAHILALATPAILERVAEHDRKVREAALEEAALKARTTPFRCHAANDRDFHSGCVQTQDSIVDAIRALKEKK
jgi:hypothetical protein